MIVILIVGFWFARMAREAGMNKFLWPILGIAAYFIAQIVVGFAFGVIAPELLDSTGSQLVAGIVSGGVGVVIVYFIFQNVKKNQSNVSKETDLIDRDL